MSHYCIGKLLGISYLNHQNFWMTSERITLRPQFQVYKVNPMTFQFLLCLKDELVWKIKRGSWYLRKHLLVLVDGIVKRCRQKFLLVGTFLGTNLGAGNISMNRGRGETTESEIK